MSKELKVTSIDDLHMYGKGVVCQLPDFADGQPFVARLRSPSLLVLVETGKIPNSLLATANRMFNGVASKEENLEKEDELKNVSQITITMAKAALAEPTYEDIQKAELTLTDKQLLAIFNYTQIGIRALDSFRKLDENFTNDTDGEDVFDETESNTVSE